MDFEYIGIRYVVSGEDATVRDKWDSNSILDFEPVSYWKLVCWCVIMVHVLLVEKVVNDEHHSEIGKSDR